MADNTRPIGANTAARRALTGKLQSNPIGERIKTLRRQKAMTQTALAQGTFSPSYLSAVESGRIKPSLSALSILSDRLEVALSTLIGENGDALSSSGARNASAEEMERQDIALAQAEAALEGGNLANAQRLLGDLAGKQVSPTLAPRYGYLQGWASLVAGDLDQAEEQLRAALNQAGQSESPELTPRLHNLLGQLYQQKGDTSKALSSFLKAQQDVEGGKVKEGSFRLALLGHTADAYVSLGNSGQAINLYREALGEGDEGQDAASDSFSLSEEYLKTNNYRLARQAAQRSLHLYENRSQERQRGRLTGMYGMMLLDSDNLDQAEQQLKRATDLLTTAGDNDGLALAHANMARLALARGDKQAAGKAAAQAEQLAGEAGDPRILGQILSVTGQIAEQSGDTAAADAAFKRSLSLLEQAGAGDLVGKVSFSYGQTLLARNDSANAASYLQKAYLAAGRRFN